MSWVTFTALRPRLRFLLGPSLRFLADIPDITLLVDSLFVYFRDHGLECVNNRFPLVFFQGMFMSD